MVDTGFHSHQAEGCAVCGENHPFDMPPELVSAALSGDLVIFAGAGISTESRRTYGGTFADRIARELGLDEAPSFPELMTAYEQAHGRAQLLQRIRARIDYVDSFPELRRLVTRFHHELATASCDM